MIETLALTIAIRHIISRRRQTILCVLAVALAVSISVIFTSLVTGQQQILTDLVEEKLPHIVVKPLPGEEFIHLYKSLLDKISTIPGIKSRASSLSSTATLSYKDRTKNALLKGSDPHEIDSIYKIGSSMVQGDLGSIQQPGKAALGRTLAENLDIKLGDKIFATFPDARATNLTVTGIFFTGTPLDQAVAFVSLKTARNFRDKGDVINAVEISLQDIGQAEDLAARISSRGYNALSWQKNNPEIMRAINIGGFWTRFSVLLFMVVAFFGVASIMNLLVVEKTREIGMLMAMGTKRSNIRDIFLLESAILGSVGAAAGTALGLAGVMLLGNIPFEIAAGGSEITTLPLIINPQEILLLVFWAVVLSIVAAVHPARKASRLDPVMALRGG
ncbi:MAG: lipoprotein-releasing system permease protein [Euryarchaeota archaeon]|nr:lipoprotein-releasing system permease protein [Euryarchaeota archaeon]